MPMNTNSNGLNGIRLLSSVANRGGEKAKRLSRSHSKRENHIRRFKLQLTITHGTLAPHNRCSCTAPARYLFLLCFLPITALAQFPQPDSFNPGASGSPNPWAEPRVASVAVQVDGKVLVGGHFLILGGQACTNMGRLIADGTADPFRFEPGPSDLVSLLAVQSDGKILLGGEFSEMFGVPMGPLARLDADGQPDFGFFPHVRGGTVFSIALQADDKILVGGRFFMVGLELHDRLARIDADGSVDSGFNPSADDHVYALTVQPDGKILVGGKFTTLEYPWSSMNLGRLNADGSLDREFGARVEGRYSCVFSLAVQADGKILVGGSFSALGGQPRANIARLNADGTVDGAFNPGANGSVSCLALQADGKILVGGSFTELGGQPRSNIARLNPNGTLDNQFDPGANGTVSCLALQADGKILVGGYFTTLAGQPRDCIGRLNNTEPSTEILGSDGSTIIWLRTGPCPELSRSTFDSSDDGATWVGLGTGARIPGGWQLSGVSLPSGSVVRARGFVTGGNAADWFVETVWQQQPGPDLRVASLGVPVEAVAGSTQMVAWSVINAGTAPATNDWVDRVYLSTDDALGNDRFLGEFPAGDALNTNQSITQTQSIAVPADLEPDRNYWWIVITDAASAISEETDLNNVCVADAPMRLLQQPESPAWLRVERAAGLLMNLELHGTPGQRYGLQTSTNLAGLWDLVESFTLSNSLRSITWTNAGEPTRLFRLLKQ
jgi:uncharacterized delta-60 repeat protein